MNISEFEPLFKKQGFLSPTLVDLKKSVSFEAYKAQVWNNNIGNMEFLKTHTDFKDPKKQSYESAIVALYPYHPQVNNLKSSLRIALYAQEKDYHSVIKEKLEKVVEGLKLKHPNIDFKACVDSYPVLERDLAYRAGLGWIGKNTCLINRDEGSLFYICEILTTQKTNSKAGLYTDHCGTCTKCIDACPTGALTPRKLEVDKCISYRNIEDKESGKDSLNKKLHGWFFGCDICQTVCPWNEKKHGKAEMQNLSQDFHFSTESIEELKFILSSSNKSLMETYKDFPINRARGTGLKRNALKLIYEYKLRELKEFLQILELPDKIQGLRDEVLKSL